ncbi:MAG: MFS transporter [Alphaproteobacteria bacterium]|nr:MFS transporter [Alphaproteobacteria bacterium]
MNFSYAILKKQNFRLLIATRMFSNMALQSLSVIIGWQIYELTNDPLMLGLIGLTEAVPAIIGALFSGYIVDISTPHHVYKACITALILNLLFLLSVGGGFFSVPQGAVIPLLFLGIFVSGLARSFLMPAHFSITPQIVDKKDYASANGWSNTAFQVSVIMGPILGGAVYGFYGVSSAWILPISFMILALLCILNIKNLREYEKFDKKGRVIENIIDGWKFILLNPMLLTVMALDMLAVLFGGAIAILPAFAAEVLMVGPEGLGILRTAPGLGAIVSAIYLALRPMKIFTLQRMLWSVIGFGLSMIGFGLSTSFLLCFVFLGLSGLFDTVSVIIRSTLKQILTPDHMRGRVSSISFMFVVSSNEIGSFESGVAARALGLVPSILFGGIMTLFVAGITFYMTPSLRKHVFDENGISEAK